ncbi:MAG: hypothetical protein Q4G28_08990 [Neisseria sp.]|nr:hypothetical protein [Neisseria sp.]
MNGKTHWLAKAVTLAIGLAVVALLTLLAASFFRHVFDFDILNNYAALMMVCITLITLAAPLLLSLYRKYIQHCEHAPHPPRKFFAHR